MTVAELIGFACKPGAIIVDSLKSEQKEKCKENENAKL